MERAQIASECVTCLCLNSDEWQENCKCLRADGERVCREVRMSEVVLVQSPGEIFIAFGHEIQPCCGNWISNQTGKEHEVWLDATRVFVYRVPHHEHTHKQSKNGWNETKANLWAIWFPLNWKLSNFYSKVIGKSINLGSPDTARMTMHKCLVISGLSLMDPQRRNLTGGLIVILAKKSSYGPRLQIVLSFFLLINCDVLIW